MDGVKTGDDGMIAWFSSTFRSFKLCCFCEIYQLDSDTGSYFAFWRHEHAWDFKTPMKKMKKISQGKVMSLWSDDAYLENSPSPD